LDWLSDKSSGTSEFWEASRAKNLEPSVLVSLFFLIRELQAELVVKKEKPHLWFVNNNWCPTYWLSYSNIEKLR
jgi:hypothetical protein